MDGDKSDARVVATLRGHTGLVTGLSYEHLEGDSTEAYSCGVDGMVRVWRREKGAEVFEWVSSQVMDGLTSACVGISSVSTKKGVILSASDSGGKVMIWSRLHTSSQFEVVHIVTMPPQTPHVHLARLDDDDAVCLLIGANNRRSTLGSFNFTSPPHSRAAGCSVDTRNGRQPLL